MSSRRQGSVVRALLKGVSPSAGFDHPGRGTQRERGRWITLGKDMAGRYVLVVHTFEQLSMELGRIRVISARTPTSAEVHVYEESR